MSEEGWKPQSSQGSSQPYSSERVTRLNYMCFWRKVFLSVHVFWRSWRFWLLLYSSFYLKVGKETERTRWWVKFGRFRNPLEILTSMETGVCLRYAEQKMDFIKEDRSKNFTEPTIHISFYLSFWGAVFMRKDVPSAWHLKCRGLQGYFFSLHKLDDSSGRAFQRCRVEMWHLPLQANTSRPLLRRRNIFFFFFFGCGKLKCILYSCLINGNYWSVAEYF